MRGDKVDVKAVKRGYAGPTSMTATGGTLYIVEAKINQYGKGKIRGPFYVYPTRLPED